MTKDAAGPYERFEALTAAHWGAAFGLIYRIVHSREVAEDVLQDALVRAMRGFESLRDEAAAKSWLLRIAHTTALNWLRANRRSTPVDFVDDLTLHDIDDKDPTPEEIVAHRDEVSSMGRLVEQLPPIYREILVLRYMQELSYKELAEVIGIPMSSVKFRLHQAVKLLKEKVEKKF